MIDDLVTRGVDRAVPHVHLPRRVPADAARRQCRPAPDAAWHRHRLRRQRAARLPLPPRPSSWSRATALLREPRCSRRTRPPSSGSSSIATGASGARSNCSATPRSMSCASRPSGRRSTGSTETSPSSSRSTRATRSTSRGRNSDIASFRKDEAIAIPAEFAFRALPGLSTELRQKLERHRPASLGQAARLDGMTPAALMLLLAHLKKGQAARSA